MLRTSRRSKAAAAGPTKRHIQFSSLALVQASYIRTIQRGRININTRSVSGCVVRKSNHVSKLLTDSLLPEQITLKTEDGSGKTRLSKLFVFLDYFSDALIQVTGSFCPVRRFQPIMTQG
jgi:hypothetical protein